MGKQPLGAATLSTLPEDVHLQLLDLLPPAQIAVFAELSLATSEIAAAPSVWASVARRHLAVVPPIPHPSASAVLDLARSLVYRWWVATGLFVPGVPVHRRKGFISASARGGVEIPLTPDGAEACYVFGGRHAHLSTPASAPAVDLQFALDPAGPFPVDGLVLRLHHAAEPVPSCDSPEEDPVDIADLPKHTHARVRVALNNVPLTELVISATGRFETVMVPVPARMLLSKPTSNVLTVGFDRASRAGYWLRDVTLTPVVLPPPPLAMDTPEIPVGPDEHSPAIMTSTTTSPMMPTITTAVTEPSTEDPPTVDRQMEEDPRHESPSPRRRAQGSRSRDSARSAARERAVLASSAAGGEHVQQSRSPRAKHQKGVKPSKHMFHHHQHHRNSRRAVGPAPKSPRSPRR